MKPIELKEMQQIELNLLKEFDKLCKEEKLRYYIDGGTLLGAMCYEGFIPWDDDIDLKMPRYDYDRLKTIENKLPDYITLLLPTKEKCEYTMCKLVDNRTVLIEKQNENIKKTGVYIDILPMDGHPVNDDNHFKKLQKYNSLFHYSLEKFKYLKKSDSFFTKAKGYVYSAVYSPWHIYQRLTNISKKYDYDKCEYVGLVIEGDYRKERFKRINLDNCVYLQFEDMMVPAPTDYEKHLQQFYGNHINRKEHYHNLPYIKPSHDYEVFWKDQ